MKLVKVDVKSRGTLIKSIEVEQFEKLDEAIHKFGKENCLEKINRMYRTDEMNTVRRESSEETDPIKKLSKMLKANPELIASVQAAIQKQIAEATKTVQTVQTDKTDKTDK